MFLEQSAPLSSSFVWTVSQLNDEVSRCLQVNFPPLWVGGEVRDFTRAASGHWYFTLKDATGELSCAMFAGSNRRVGFIPKTGDHLEVHGQVSVYRARGSYQMVVDSVRQAGLGELYERFLRLKQKLQAEGLFSPARKKSLRRVYTKIAVVTSLQAAALRDVLTTLRRRAPYAKVTIFETAVQGAEAPEEIIRALRKADTSEAVEVILLVRGGGSIQDLWSFNDERVARTIAQLSKPVIVGVGHESDVTIADWVADLRAATPTAAAEHVTESSEVLWREISQMYGNLQTAWEHYWTESSQRVDSLLREIPDPAKSLQHARERLTQNEHLLTLLMFAQWKRQSENLNYLRESLVHPSHRLAFEKERHERLSHDLTRYMSEKITAAQRQCIAMTDLLTETSPQAIMKKGYSFITAKDGRYIKSAATLGQEKELTIHWHDGRTDVRVVD